MRLWPLRLEVWATADRQNADEESGGGGGGATADQQRTHTLIEALEGVEYPITSQGLLDFADRRGITEIQWGDRRLKLRDLFLQFPNLAFLSRGDVENIVSMAEERLG